MFRETDERSYFSFSVGLDVSKVFSPHYTGVGPYIIVSRIIVTLYLKARLHRRFLSQQLDAIFVAPKLHQVSDMFETPAISRRQIAVKIAPGLHVRF